MADFEIAYEITHQYEGGYANDPVDVGGETYKGIARRYHPDWDGWIVIDAHKGNENFPGCLDSIVSLQRSVRAFFKKNYWDRFQGDFFADQSIANEMFDAAVNMGVSRAVRFLQSGLNLLNRNQQNYPDIVEDGRFGPVTADTLRQYLTIDSNIHLLKIMIILRGMHYITYMRQNPAQERFARGWLNRIHLGVL